MCGTAVSTAIMCISGDIPAKNIVGCVIYLRSPGKVGYIKAGALLGEAVGGAVVSPP
jgi:hypothetical protein